MPRPNRVMKPVCYSLGSDKDDSTNIKNITKTKQSIKNTSSNQTKTSTIKTNTKTKTNKSKSRKKSTKTKVNN